MSMRITGIGETSRAGQTESPGSQQTWINGSESFRETARRLATDIDLTSTSTTGTARETNGRQSKEISLEDYRMIMLLIMSGASKETVVQEIADALGISAAELAQLKACAGSTLSEFLASDDTGFDALLNAPDLSEQTRSDIMQLKDLAERVEAQRGRDKQLRMQQSAAHRYLRPAYTK